LPEKKYNKFYALTIIYLNKEKSINMKSYLSIFFCLFVSTLQAQYSSKDLCRDGDCAEKILQIELNEPINPDPSKGYTEQRTKRFQKAYLVFKEISDTYTKSSTWQANYEASNLGGKNCLRHYQLESYFTNEYLNNEAFKKFIAAQGVNGEAFKQRGFRSSRKGLNLDIRMSKRCRLTVNDFNKQRPNKEGMRNAYAALGKDQGYFDNQGRPIIAAPTPQKKLSKRKQIKLLKEQVAQLPDKVSSQQTLDTLLSALKVLQPETQSLNNTLNNKDSYTPILKDEPSSYVNKTEEQSTDIGELASFQPRVVRPELDNKIKGLAQKGHTLKKQAERLFVSGSGTLQEYNQAGEKANKISSDLNKSIEIVERLKEQLAQIDKQKTTLTLKIKTKTKKNTGRTQN